MQAPSVLRCAEGDYDCDLTVIADGWKFTIQDPYSAAPVLLVRRPGSGEEGMSSQKKIGLISQCEPFSPTYNHSRVVESTDEVQDDCYYSEFEALVGVIDGSLHKDRILSDYADAVETYKLVSPSCYTKSTISSPLTDMGYNIRWRGFLPRASQMIGRLLAFWYFVLYAEEPWRMMV